MRAENGAKSERPIALDAVVGEGGQLDRFALERLEGELLERGDFARLLSLYEEAQIVAPDAEVGRELLLKAGFLSLDKLSDPPGAESFFRRILSHDPENIDAYAALNAWCPPPERRGLALIDPVVTLAQLRETGFDAKILPAYDSLTLPPGLVAFLCRKA